jgi:hypothetical protein
MPRSRRPRRRPVREPRGERRASLGRSTDELGERRGQQRIACSVRAVLRESDHGRDNYRHRGGHGGARATTPGCSDTRPGIPQTVRHYEAPTKSPEGQFLKSVLRRSSRSSNDDARARGEAVRRKSSCGPSSSGRTTSTFSSDQPPSAADRRARLDARPGAPTADRAPPRGAFSDRG